MGWRWIAIVSLVSMACGDGGAREPETGTTGGTTAGSSGSSGTTTTATESDTGDATTLGDTTGADTTGGEPDPTPILDRPPAITHDCSETRPMTQPAGATQSRSEGIVVLDDGAYELLAEDTFVLRQLALDGTVGASFVLNPAVFEVISPIIARVDDDASIAWINSTGVGASEIRYARIAAGLDPVVSPTMVSGLAGEYMTPQALVAAESDTVALFFDTSDGGANALQMVTLGADGETIGSPVDIADLGGGFATSNAVASSTVDGGIAVAYTIGVGVHTEVHFVTLDVDGTPRHEATRISAPGEPGRSSFTFGGRRGIVPVGDGVWVAYIENTADDETQLGSREIVIAVVDAEGNADLHRLQDLGDGEESRVPLFVPYDDHVGLMWTTGHIIWICAGCISDHDAHFVLLDAQDLVPASNVATHLHVDNGLTRPWVGELGENLLTTSSLDFHAVSIAASGAMRCEAPG